MIKRIYVLRDKSTREVRFLFTDPEKWLRKMPDGFEKVGMSFCGEVHSPVENGIFYELTQSGFVRIPEICKEA